LFYCFDALLLLLSPKTQTFQTKQKVEREKRKEENKRKEILEKGE
jgi:hypothetical protein